jgi:hypothetical protein
MVSGPPCPRCGYPLRWFAEQNAWGCDREQQMFPPQAVVQQQQQPMQQQGAPRKSRGKWYALGGLVVIGAIVTIAVVATRKGDPATEGYNDLWLIAMDKARDKICACSDEPCVHDAINDLEKRHKELADHLDLKGDDEKRQQKLGDEMQKCIKNVPGTDKPHKAAAKAGDDAFKDVMLELRDLRDKMCSCKAKMSTDPYCAAQVKADFESAMSSWKKTLGDSTISADDEKMLKQGMLELLACEEAAKKKE